jgi:arylsulfatase A-like enzyme
VPFAIQWPAAIPAGRKSDAPVIALDLFATAIAAAGIDKTPGKELDGVNLLPLMTGKTQERPHRTLYWKSGPAWAVRDGDLKLVAGNAGVRDAEPALFDLAKDPSESRDLAAGRPDEVKRLQALYQAWAATHQATPWGRGAQPSRKRRP